MIGCNCSDVGSQSLQCDEDGICLCNVNVLGDKCDECRENSFMNESTGLCTGKIFDILLELAHIFYENF